MFVDWLKNIDRKDLFPIVPLEAAMAIDDLDTALELAADGAEHRAKSKGKRPMKMAYKKAAGSKLPARKKSRYWKSVKKEFLLLVCTDDAKYEPLRQEFSKSSRSATVVIVGTISAAISAAVGTTAGLCFPVVAVLLMSVTAVGKNAFCSLAVKPSEAAGRFKTKF